MSAREWHAAREQQTITDDGGDSPMMLCSVPGFLLAMREARAQRPDLPARAWHEAARTQRPAFSRLRVSPALIVRWAEFYSLMNPAALAR